MARSRYASFIFCALIIVQLGLVAHAMRRSLLRMRSVAKEGDASPYTLATRLPLRMPSIILVNTFEQKNIGSVSRAMLNNGCYDLRLVAPECDPLGEEASRLAVGSVELLERAKTFPTLQAAIADLQFVLSTTSRSRSSNFHIYSPKEAASLLITPDNYYGGGSSASFKSGIVFGAEKNGLANADLDITQGIIAIDTFESYPVLNLAQAVNIVCHTLWMRKLELDEQLSTTLTLPKQSPSPDDLASQAEIDFFLQRLGQALLDRGYDKGGGEALGGLVRLVKRMPLVTKDELKMLQGVLSALLLIPRKKVE